MADDAIEDDLWATAAAELGGDDELDLQDLDDLFTKERESPRNKKTSISSVQALKAARVQLLDGKRAMNMAIALSRIKLSNAEASVRCSHAIQQAGTRPGSESTRLCHSLATIRSSRVSVTPPRSESGEVSRVSRCPRGWCMRDILEFMLRFPPRARELREQLITFIAACDDVKMSKKLRVILGVALKVGNQLNQGGKTRAFTLDSLLKLARPSVGQQNNSIGLPSEGGDETSGAARFNQLYSMYKRHDACLCRSWKARRIARPVWMAHGWWWRRTLRYLCPHSGRHY